VIAGVWLPGRQLDAEKLLARLSRAVRMTPCTSVWGPEYTLAAWSLAPDGRIDAHKGAAWIGFPRKESISLGLHEAGRLGGQYAVIAGRSNGLLLGCGAPVGRCLYFARLPGGVAACSRLEPLVACLGSVAPDRGALAASLLARSPADPTATAFREIRRVEAGQAVVIDSKGLVETAPARIDVQLRRGSPDELADELRGAIQRAVRRAIGSTPHVAVLVSGGLDSSSVLACAVAATRGAARAEVDAINWSFGGPGDDRPYVRELCDSLGILPIRISSAQAAPRILDVMTADAAPHIWPSGAPILVAHECARARGADVVLTGMGGDQIFGGDPRVLARRPGSRDWYKAMFPRGQGERSRSLLRLVRSARHLVAPGIASAFPMLNRAWRKQWVNRRWPWAGPRLRKIMLEMFVQSPPNREWSTVTSEPRLRRLVATDFALFASNCRQIEALGGVTQVDPLLDDEVVDLTSSFAQHTLLFDGRQRGLFRHAMRQMLPDRLRLRRDKATFEPALAEMVRAGDVGALRDLASMRMLGDLGLVYPPKYRQHFEAVMAAGGESREWMAVWPALAVEAFVRSQWGSSAGKESWTANV
jgi:asparagine synthetase B (glutamine-hydrolysing)